MKSICILFFVICSFDCHASQISCPSYSIEEVSGITMKTYGDGLYYWSEGVVRDCDKEGVCVIEAEGHTHRTINFNSPLSFVLDCVDKSIDFCMPLNYNVECVNHVFKIDNIDCGA
jgi:hypothetical protein